MLERIWQKIRSYTTIPQQLSFLKKQVSEIRWAEVFHDTIIDSQWLNCKRFSPSGAAANYSFLYVLYRILNDCDVRVIVEFGVGQSTLLSSQYVAFRRGKTDLFVVEHDREWISFYRSYLAPSENLHIVDCEVEEICLKGVQTTCYKGIGDKFLNQKISFIINDGPGGTDAYSRIHVLDLLDKLDDQFIILIDDVDRHGEWQTMMEVIKELGTRGRPFEHTVYNGLKSQCLIFSPNYIFLKNL